MFLTHVVSLGRGRGRTGVDLSRPPTGDSELVSLDEGRKREKGVEECDLSSLQGVPVNTVH